jgi:hypothetical protein
VEISNGGFDEPLLIWFVADKLACSVYSTTVVKLVLIVVLVLVKARFDSDSLISNINTFLVFVVIKSTHRTFPGGRVLFLTDDKIVVVTVNANDCAVVGKRQWAWHEGTQFLHTSLVNIITGNMPEPLQ